MVPLFPFEPPGPHPSFLMVSSLLTSPLPQPSIKLQIKRQQQEQLAKLKDNPVKMMELLKSLTKVVGGHRREEEWEEGFAWVRTSATPRVCAGWFSRLTPLPPSVWAQCFRQHQVTPACYPGSMTVFMCTGRGG